MRVHQFVVLAAAVALLTGCGTDAGPGGSATPSADPTAEARQRVQNYLDAMSAKDAAAGRIHLCPVLRESFDRVATGPNGDFAAHFTVTEAVITDVRPRGDDQEVRASVTVEAPDRSGPVHLLFTVTRVDGAWCIADEVPTDTDPDDGQSPSTAP